MAITIIR